MPWWGWLIAAGLVIACLTVLVMVRVMTGTMRTMSQDMDTESERWRQEHGFGRRRL